jgi:hypothetical protein
MKSKELKLKEAGMFFLRLRIALEEKGISTQKGDYDDE